LSDPRETPRLELIGTGDDAEPDRRITRRGMMSRDRIIEAALHLLAEGGYPVLSISAVCKRAQVSAASLYHHFGDKAGLLAAMIEVSMQQSTRQFVSLLSRHDRPLDQLNAFIQATKEIGRGREGNAISVLAALAQAGRDGPEVVAAVEKARNRAWHVAAAEFSDCFGIEDGMVFAHIVFAFSSYIDHVGQSCRDRDDPRALFKAFARVMFLVAAAVRPDFCKDPAFAAAVAEAAAGGLPAQDTPPSSGAAS